MLKWKTRMLSAALVLIILAGSLTVTMAAPKENEAIVKADALAIDLGLTEVINDMTLPTTGQGGAGITWQSSEPQYISTEGAVIRPAKGDQTVTLTAEVTNQGASETRMFEITVLEDTESGNLKYLDCIKESYELGFTAVYKDFILPAETGGVVINWKSADNSIQITEGNQAAVTRTAYGEGTKEAIIIGTFSIGSQSVNKKFVVQVPEMAWGYLLTYVVSEDNPQGISVGNADNCITDSLHLALSDHGSDYTALNKGKAVLYASDLRQMGSPVIFRKADGTYGVLASHNESDSNIILYDSEDLIHFKNERMVAANSQGITVRSPDAEFDTAIGAYRLYWKDENGQGYMAVTEDFTTFSEPEKTEYIKKTAAAGAAMPEYAMEAGVLELTREEYERVENKYGNLHNTGIVPIEDIKVALGEEVELPEKVTAGYNDGSAKEMSVDWDTASIDFSTEGNYTVKGTVSQDTYSDPLIENCEDPYIIYNEEDEYYYFIRSGLAVDDPENGQGNSGGRLNIRRAKKIGDLPNAEEVTILKGIQADEGEEDYRYFRAPELHKIGERWRIITYVSPDGNVIQGEVAIFTCEDGDIMNPESWTEEGTVSAGGETLGESDIAFIEAKGQCYYVTSKEGSIMITAAPTDDLLKPVGPLVKLGFAAVGWELNLNTNQEMNEELEAIKHNGKIYIAYSGSTVNQPDYTGVLYADEGSDLLDPDSWTKVPYPLLTASDNLKALSFFSDSNGNMNMVYRAKAGEEVNNGQDSSASDGQVYIKGIHFGADGTPVLNMAAQEELADQFKTVTAKVETASTVTVRYTAGTGGTVKGTTVQAIVKGTNTMEVTAEANSGYTFSKWSDGVTEAKRNDLNVTESKIVTAQFTRTAQGDNSPAEVTVSNKAVTLGIKETFALRASVLPAEAAGQVEWSSSDESVAAVSEAGQVAARKKGTATITAKTANGKTSSCEVTVLEAPEEVTAEPVEITLQNGSYVQLEIHLPEDTASNRIIYSSSNEAVAGISSKGKVTGKKRGSTTIMVETFNGKKAEVEVVVK